MKVRIIKHCKIHGEPAVPGAVHEVRDDRAKALIDNGYADRVHGSESYAEMQARVESECKMRDQKTQPTPEVSSGQEDISEDPVK